ncbi:MAG: hypothetical protein APF76_04005 [Desulfitibacter sp. BRH_c19]|nr:MAG: hypothetical protein APF76_04005 [Desulfitibacter sp. BRH_c19]
MTVSYKDFVVVCGKCGEVTWLSEKGCSKCGVQGHLISLDKAIKETGKVSKTVSVAGGIIALVGLLTIPFFGIMPGLIIYGVSSNITAKARKTKEISLKEKSEQMFRNLEVSDVSLGIESAVEGTICLEESNSAQTLSYFKSAREKGYSTQVTGLNIASEYYKMGEYSKAISLLEKLNLNSKELIGASDLLAKAYLDSGQLNYERISFILDVKGNSTKDTHDYIVLSLADYICKGDKNLSKNLDKADILREAISIAPHNIQYIETAAQIMMELGLIKSVVEYCNKINVYALSEHTTVIYAEALCMTDNLSESAIPVYKKALTINDNETILIKLCEALLNNGKYHETIDICKSALNREHYNLNLRQILALAYMRTGQLEQAISQLQTIRKKDDFQSLCS